MNDPREMNLLEKSRLCCFVTTDTDLHITAANELFKKQFLRSNTLSKQSLEQTLSNSKDALCSIVQQLQANPQQVLEFVTTQAGTQIKWNISTIQDAGQAVAGYELLGVVEQKTAAASTDKLLASHERKLKLVLRQLKKILDSSLDMICVLNTEGKVLKISAACKQILGYDQKELVGKYLRNLVYKDDLEASAGISKAAKSGEITTNFENRLHKKNGEIVHLNWSVKYEEADERYYCIARDTTEKKAGEEALKASEEKYRVLFYNHPYPMWIYNTENFRFIEVNDAAVHNYGYPREEFLQMTLPQILHQNESRKFFNLYNESDYKMTGHKGLWTHKKKDGEVIYAEVTSNVIQYKDVKAKLVLSIDRTEKIKQELELLQNNERYLFLSETAFEAIWDRNLLTGEMQWNEGFEKMMGAPNSAVFEDKDWWYKNVHEEDLERVVNKLQDTFKQKQVHWEDEYRIKTFTDQYLYVHDRAFIVYNEANEPVRIIGAMQDLTTRKAHENMLQKLNQSLERRAKELAESNAELERFAYIASHDLQEPLRMVTSFLQLLEKRYKNKLDQKAHEYINYAVDGAERMKRLILDLLEYSRVNSSKIEKEEVDVNSIVAELRLTYRNILTETRGSIIAETLPSVKANKTQLTQLLQNLVSNSIKYRSERAPQITIAAKSEARQVVFSVADNGIGIDPKFFNKIFIIFQRLHNRERYSGTGIGLAICKKIIDKHGGRIWVDSVPGQGTTFYFTLPKLK